MQRRGKDCSTGFSNSGPQPQAKRSSLRHRGDYRRYVDGKPGTTAWPRFLTRAALPCLPARPTTPRHADRACVGQHEGPLFSATAGAARRRALWAAIALVETLRTQKVRRPSYPPATIARQCWSRRISGLFDARVDGMDITRLALNGKPAPDGFLEAARRLRPTLAGRRRRRRSRRRRRRGVPVDSGLVIGIDRSGQSQALREAGADVVVTSLAQVQVTTESPSTWSLVYEGSTRRAREPAKHCARSATAISRRAGR